MENNLTDQQINQISNIVENNMNILSYIMTGSPIPDKSLLQKLHINPETLTLMMLAYKYGKFSATLPTLISNKSHIPVPAPTVAQVSNLTLTPSQQRAARRLVTRTEQVMQGFTQRVKSSIINSAISVDLSTWSSNDRGKPGWNRGEWIKMLRNITKDTERDWHRVVQTESWNAKLYGESHAIMSGESPFSSDKGETLVYKRPAPDCCPLCRKLYLERDGITPKVFKLSDLMANGDNFGKKVDEYLPTLGTVHPNCQCTLGIKPKDAEFDKDGNLVFSPTV